jgi:hypothetical protein
LIYEAERRKNQEFYSTIKMKEGRLYSTCNTCKSYV